MRAAAVSFMPLARAEGWFAVNLRDRGMSMRYSDVMASTWMRGAWILCRVVLHAAVLGGVLPGIRFYSAKTRHSGEQENPGVG